MRARHSAGCGPSRPMRTVDTPPAPRTVDARISDRGRFFHPGIGDHFPLLLVAEQVDARAGEREGCSFIVRRASTPVTVPTEWAVVVAVDWRRGNAWRGKGVACAKQ